MSSRIPELLTYGCKCNGGCKCSGGCKAINLETVDNMQELRQIARYIDRVNEIIN